VLSSVVLDAEKEKKEALDWSGLTMPCIIAINKRRREEKLEELEIPSIFIVATILCTCLTDYCRPIIRLIILFLSISHILVFIFTIALFY
jgi:hypothetical protein